MSVLSEARRIAARRARFWRWHAAAWWNGGRRGYVRRPAQVHRIAPERIRHIVRDQPRLAHLYGRILAGDWDVPSAEFDRSLVFRALRERFLEGMEWASTRFHDRVLEEIAAGAVRWDCRTPGEWARRLEEVDRLFETIRREGYRAQHELGTLRPWDEIKVCVDRHGEVLFVDGRHRLGIAKLLGLESVPVIVTVWHPRALDGTTPEAVTARLRARPPSGAAARVSATGS